MLCTCTYFIWKLADSKQQFWDEASAVLAAFLASCFKLVSLTVWRTFLKMLLCWWRVSHAAEMKVEPHHAETSAEEAALRPDRSWQANHKKEWSAAENNSLAIWLCDWKVKNSRLSAMHHGAWGLRFMILSECAYRHKLVAIRSVQ